MTVSSPGARLNVWHVQCANVRQKRQSQNVTAWDKAAFCETEWDATLSRDVARQLREATVTSGPSYVYAKSTPAKYTPVLLNLFRLPPPVLFLLSLLGQHLSDRLVRKASMIGWGHVGPS